MPMCDWSSDVCSSDLLEHHSSKASVLWHSAFFIVQLSHPYRATGKTIALTRRTFVGKVMSLSFNMLSRLVITFLPRSKRLLISWLQSPSAEILEPTQNKVCHCFHCFPTICHEVMGLDAQAAKKGGGHLAALSWPNLCLSCCVGLFKGTLCTKVPRHAGFPRGEHRGSRHRFL